MPVYQYRCSSPECQHEFEAANEIETRHEARCPRCKATAKKLFLPLQVGGFKERDVKLWNARRKVMEKVHVSTREQLVRACDRRGLIHRGYSYHDQFPVEEG